MLKKYFPEAQIDWVVDKRNFEILENHPYINRLLIFSKNIFFSLGEFK
ncbi:MAG: lipopolysaccharide heptosyltransferase I, partial [Thermodesulfobacterium geofontis]